MPPAGRQASPARSTVSDDGNGVAAGGSGTGEEALARDLPRAAAARDGRLALLPLPEPRRHVHAVALPRRPEPVVDPAGPGLRGDERHGALGGAADRAPHAELVRRRDVAARRQRRRQRHPGRSRHGGRVRVPAARPRGRAAARTSPAGWPPVSIANTTTILAFPVLALPAILGGLQAPKGLLTTAYIGGGRVRARGPRRVRSVPLGPPVAAGRARRRRRAPAVPRQARRARLGRAAARAARRVTGGVRRAVAVRCSARSSRSRASTISASSAAWPRSAPGRIRRSSCSPTPARCCSR